MTIKKLQSQLRKAYATNALRLHSVRIQFDKWRMRHGLKLGTLLLIAALISSVIMLPLIQRATGGYFEDGERIAALRSLLSDTGAALIGATAIAFSLVVFAMQINVERMPHGLFRRLSSDKRLLGSFLGSFLAAIVVVATSLIPDGSWVAIAIFAALWGIVVILLLFLYAYRRALQLINPIEQLAIMSRAVQEELRKWKQLADKAAILLDDELQTSGVEDGTELQFNASKSHFFQVNAHWTNAAGQAIHYAISYAKRFAEQGDYEVTEFAYERIMLINATYCAAKHGTFVGSNPLFEMPGTTDSFINSSLEQMRQTMQTALARGDERLAESTLRAIGGLYGVYLMIEYPRRDQTKYHAFLAAGYMGSAVESVIPHNMPDLMMEGIRLMGRASRLALDHTGPTEIVGTAEKIAILSYVGALKTNHQPVTLTAFEQLADITYDLLVKGKHDIRFPVRQLRSAVTAAAKRFLETPETPLSPQHSNALGPYFSSTNVSSLRGKITSLANQLLEVPADNARAGEIIGNIATWADQIYDSQKELLLFALQKRSSFTFDVISWAFGISELLNALSNAPACTRHLKDDLRKHAMWLVSTLSWLPDDRESVIFAENYTFTESLFEAAMGGLQRDCLEYYESCRRLLMAWASKGGKHETGGAILEHAIKGLVALAMSEGTAAAATALKTQLRQMFNSNEAASPKLRARAAASLTRSANDFRRYDAMHSPIEYALAQLDRTAVRTLMLEIVEILAPDPPVQT